MRFSPDGSVHACCVNDSYPLGRVDLDRLVDVWRGERMEALRRALGVGDPSLGCIDCALDEVEGRRELSHAAHYDRWEGRTGDWPLRLEFAMSNNCNLMCVHCNGELSSAIRARREGLPPVPDRYGEQFFADVHEFLEHVEVTAFLGGEPFLGRHARRIWDDMIEIGRPVEVNVTTNGTIWNEQVERYLTELRMNVAISIDGIERETFEAIRVGAEFDQVMATRDRMHALVEGYGGAFTINHCLLLQNATELYRMLADADEHGMRVEVIPVSYPARHSVFRLPLEQRIGIAEQLRQEAARNGQLQLNAASFDAALEALEADDPLSGPGAGRGIDIEVEIANRRGALMHPEQLMRESTAELTEFGSAPPLRLEIVAGVVTAVDAPEWAEQLAPQDWLGQREPVVLESICARLGGTPSWETRTRWTQVTEIDLLIEHEDSSVRFRVHRLDEEIDGRSHGTLFIASPDLDRTP